MPFVVFFTHCSLSLSFPTSPLSCTSRTISSSRRSHHCVVRNGNGPYMGHGGEFGPQQGPRAVAVSSNTAKPEFAGVATELRFETGEESRAVSRAKISVPPGFSVPNRAPPPGFSSLERMGQAFDSLSGNSLLNPSILLRDSYQTPSTGNIGGPGDIEFMDPAILAVDKGRIQGARNSPVLEMRSNYPEQLNYFENEARLQLLMQRSLSPQQNLRFSEIRNTFSQLGDAYGISSRLNESQVSHLASFPQLSLQQSRNVVLLNGQLDGWNEVQSGNSLGVAELLRNERLGFNKFYSGYDDSKYWMPNSRDHYNRTFGI